MQSRLCSLCLFCLAGVAATARQPAGEPQPKPAPVVARGDGHVIHAVGQYANGAIIRTERRAEPTDFTLVHTDLKTGTLRVLFTPQAGGENFIGGINRFSSWSSHFAGALADEHRLYVLVKTFSATTRTPPGTGTTFAESHSLEVFWRVNGERLVTLYVKSEQLKEWPLRAAPVDLAKSPLTRVADGVACFGVEHRFDSKKLKKPADGKDKQE